MIVHDGIDEQLGGYWDHLRESTSEQRTEAFRKFWDDLESNHLAPLIKTASANNIRLILPYLDASLLKYTSSIPLADRVKEEEGKAPLKEVARRLGVPAEIVDRKKRGAVGMTELK